MEQLKIVFEIAAKGFLTTLVIYLGNASFQQLRNDYEDGNKLANIITRFLSGLCLSFAIGFTIIGLIGDVPKANTIFSVVSFLVYAFVFLMFSYSFIPPKKIMFIKLP